MYKTLILLFKWWWRFSQFDNTLWKKILLSVYNIKGLKASSENFRNIKDGLWAQLTGNDVESVKIRSIIEGGSILKVGNGESIFF